MSGDPFRKALAGEPLRMPASAYNGFIDAALDLRNRRGQPSRPPPGGASDRAVVFILNASEDDVPRFGVLGIAGPLIDPADNPREFGARVMLSGDTPAIEDHFGKFAVAIEPILAGKVGRAMVDGVGIARVHVPAGAATPAAADVEDGNVERLKIAPDGAARILWIEPGDDGDKLAIVRLRDRESDVCIVELDQVGGAAGDESGPATWTYDVVDPASGVTLAEAVDPTAAPHRFARPAVGAMTAATFGYAHRAGGELALGWINEVPVQEACESSGEGEGEVEAEGCGCGDEEEEAP
ncbi:MAG: hypothetical protein IBJ10_02260 [Phycisphaerales bacterium]|nr:hypothetical protein [Phycisphaerales bacterium]